MLYGAAGNDYIDARGSDDIVYGGADNDTVLGATATTRSRAIPAMTASMAGRG
ncbi:MAG: hypothetical protein HZT43_12485 [Exiguobacterium profundum]|nr:MAG: hypothetical protein HZT43_12485 [Exiguobacterium profundum]